MICEIRYAADQLASGLCISTRLSDVAFVQVSKNNNRKEDERKLKLENDRLNKSYPLEDQYKIIREYLDGNRKETEADCAEKVKEGEEFDKIS